MELIEKLQKIIEREIDNVPMVLTDPLTLRRLRAERLAQAALAALIEHAGQDGVTEMSTQDALDFIGTAMRNWRHVRFDKEELEDFRVALQLRDARHRALAFAENERLREALERSREGWENAIELGLIPERYRNTAQILAENARAALGDTK